MISPREIDETLHRFPGVELAAAVGVPDSLYGEEVVAFVKMRGGGLPPEAAIREFCAGRLSGFKIPRRIYGLEEFPKGPSGKIQRLKLVGVYQSLPAGERLPERAPAVRKPRRKGAGKSWTVDLDPRACKSCGYCATVCAKDVFAPGEAINDLGYAPYVAARPEACNGCGLCFFVCPDFCLEIGEAEFAGAAP